MASLGGKQLVTAVIHETTSGNWAAECEALLESEPSGPIELEVAGVTWKGHVYRSVDNFDAWRVLVEGAPDDLNAPRTASDYLFASRSTIAARILADSAAVFSPSADAAALAQILQRWHQSQGPMGASLSALFEAGGYVWRTLRDGTLTVEAEGTTSEAPALDGFYLQNSDPERNSRLYLADEPLLTPTMVVDGLYVRQVMTTLAPDGVTQEIFG